jgi:hypothetical protein
MFSKYKCQCQQPRKPKISDSSPHLSTTLHPLPLLLSRLVFVNLKEDLITHITTIIMVGWFIDFYYQDVYLLLNYNRNIWVQQIFFFFNCDKRWTKEKSVIFTSFEVGEGGSLLYIVLLLVKSQYLEEKLYKTNSLTTQFVY